MISSVLIEDALKYLKAGCGPQVFTVKRLNGWTGLRYGDIRYLETIRVIPPAYRDEENRNKLLWERADAIGILERILRYCEAKEELRIEGKHCDRIDAAHVLMNAGKLCAPREELCLAV